MGMDVAVEPETGLEVSAITLRTVLTGEETREFLQILDHSRAPNPAKKAYLEEAVAFSRVLLRTGHLPD